MNTQLYLPEQINRVFEKWSRNMENIPDDRQKIDYFRKELPVILKDKSFFVDIMGKVVKGSPYPDTRRSSLFENEVILFYNVSHHFSVRFAVYEPGEYTIIHDHSSWGVFGTVLGSLEVIKYRRMDDGSMKHHAKLAEIERVLLNPTDTEFTLPLDMGIHSIGNPGGQLILTSSVYGKPLRRLFVNSFDIKNETIYPVYPPKIKKKRQALELMELLISGSD